MGGFTAGVWDMDFFFGLVSFSKGHSERDTIVDYLIYAPGVGPKRDFLLLHLLSIFEFP